MKPARLHVDNTTLPPEEGDAKPAAATTAPEEVPPVPSDAQTHPSDEAPPEEEG